MAGEVDTVVTIGLVLCGVHLACEPTGRPTPPERSLWVSARSSRTAHLTRARRQGTFLVEAISSRNEQLTAEVKARTAGIARNRAIHDFECEDHNILSATVTERKGAGDEGK